MKKIDYRGAVIPIILLLVWSVSAQQKWIDAAFLPPLSTVWDEFVKGWQSGELRENGWCFKKYAETKQVEF